MVTANASAQRATKTLAGFDVKWFVIGATVILIAWLALVPLAFLLWQSFMTPLSALEPARFTLDNYRNVYANADTFRLLLNSVVFAGGASALSLSLGTALAWMNERT